MSWLSNLERKYGKYAIPNITMYLIVCYAFGYVIEMFNASFLQYLTLNPYAIIHGQIWRLFTWIIIPPEGFSFFTLIMLYFYWSIGTTLERNWGTFAYNVYLISGMLFTVIGAFLFMLLCFVAGLDNASLSMQMVQYFEGTADLKQLFAILANQFSTYYVCMSIILAFAMTFPDVQVLLMFVLPIKIKVMGIIYVLIIGYDFVASLISAFQYRESVVWTLFGAKCFAILFSLLSCIIFFITTRKSFRSPKQMKRQAQFHKKVVLAKATSLHKCAICGQTSEDLPNVDFRFCSKCKGNFEYCPEHLFTHEHVK